jgi:hypothetical protein
MKAVLDQAVIQLSKGPFWYRYILRQTPLFAPVAMTESIVGRSGSLDGAAWVQPDVMTASAEEHGHDWPLGDHRGLLRRAHDKLTNCFSRLEEHHFDTRS